MIPRKIRKTNIPWIGNGKSSHAISLKYVSQIVFFLIDMLKLRMTFINYLFTIILSVNALSSSYDLYLMINRDVRLHNAAFVEFIFFVSD